MTTFACSYSSSSSTNPTFIGSDTHTINTIETTALGLTQSVINNLYLQSNSAPTNLENCYIEDPTCFGPTFTNTNTAQTTITIQPTNFVLAFSQESPVTLGINSYTNTNPLYMKFTGGMSSIVQNPIKWSWTPNASSFYASNDVAQCNMQVTTQEGVSLSGSLSANWGVAGMTNNPSTLQAQASNSVQLAPQQTAYTTLTATQCTYIFRLDLSATIAGNIAECLQNGTINWATLQTSMQNYGSPTTFIISLFITMTQTINPTVSVSLAS